MLVNKSLETIAYTFATRAGFPCAKAITILSAGMSLSLVFSAIVVDANPFTKKPCRKGVFTVEDPSNPNSLVQVTVTNDTFHQINKGSL